MGFVAQHLAVWSYLSNRLQLVQYWETCFIRRPLSCGVPQVSILGPLLFALYINDLPCATHLVEIMHFADDTSVFYSNPDLNCAISAVHNDLGQIDLFKKANKLSVNIAKTNFIIFAARQKTVGFAINHPVLYDGVLLKQKRVVKFLGVFIDEHLTWKPQITYICKKISKPICFMFRSCFLLSETTKKSLYYTLNLPLSSECALWNIISPLKILNIYNIYSFYAAQFMFSYYHQLSPPLFFGSFWY